MEALWGLAAWWHEQQLTKQTCWTAGVFDEVEGDIVEARDIAFVMGYLDEEEARAKEAKQLSLEQSGTKEEERICFREELGDVDYEQWWVNMMVAELGVVAKQQQGSQPAAWLDEDDDTVGEQPISSPPREALSGTHLTFSCQAVVDGMQAGDEQRGRKFQAVAQEGGEQEESRRLGGGLGFGFFVWPGEEHGQRRRRCPLRERQRKKEKTIACHKSTCSRRHVLLCSSEASF